MPIANINRRIAMGIMTGAIASSFVGCAAVAHAGRVIVTLPWARISRITSVVLQIANNTIAVVAQLANAIQTMTANLTKEQTTALADGGTLVLKSKDGQEFEVAFTIQ